jgi:hypothetical protein
VDDLVHEVVHLVALQPSLDLVVPRGDEAEDLPQVRVRRDPGDDRDPVRDARLPGGEQRERAAHGDADEPDAPVEGVVAVRHRQRRGDRALRRLPGHGQLPQAGQVRDRDEVPRAGEPLREQADRGLLASARGGAVHEHERRPGSVSRRPEKARRRAGELDLLHVRRAREQAHDGGEAPQLHRRRDDHDRPPLRGRPRRGPGQQGRDGDEGDEGEQPGHHSHRNATGRRSSEGHALPSVSARE